MNYKKIISSRKLRFAILNFFSFIPSKLMLQWQYRMKLGRKLNFNEPRRYTEKLQLYKLYYRNNKLPICGDKYEVRSYVISKGLKHILNKLYGVYQKAEEISFDSLPNKFVIKTTDGGGGNNIIICKDKSSLNITKTIKEVNSWLNKKDIDPGREWAYTGMKSSRIVVEEYLENDDNPEAGISDYKFLCFSGEPYCIVYDIDRYIGHKRNFYDINWNNLGIESDCPGFKDEEKQKPEKLDEMVEVARILSKDFPFVRVDLYYLRGKIYFGELTFYPWSGYVQFTPDCFDYILGDKFDISLFYNDEV